MGLPQKIIRLDDGMEFFLNKEDDLYYINIRGLRGTSGYTYGQLVLNNPELFQPSDKYTEAEIKAMQEAWYERVRQQYG